MPYADSVLELLEAKEGEHIQFKEAKNRFDFGEAAKCCCALANNGGGKLVFGISDKRPRSVVGSEAFNQPERTRMGLIEKLKINIDFQLFHYKGKRVLVFAVKSRPIGLPVQCDGVAWIYEGDTLKPMPVSPGQTHQRDRPSPRIEKEPPAVRGSPAVRQLPALSANESH